jgi:hypothetical protein
MGVRECVSFHLAVNVYEQLGRYMSSADKPSPPIGNAATKVFAADVDRFLTFMWQLHGCNVDRYKCSKVIIPAPAIPLPASAAGARLFEGNEANTGTCITHGPVSLDPTSTLEVFLKSPDIDIFVVYFSGPATADGSWVFPNRAFNFDDMLVLWTSAMGDLVLRRRERGQGAVDLPRLIVVTDSSLSGNWVTRARQTYNIDTHLPGSGNVAVQASCGDKELSYQHANAGGCFTNLFCSYAQHGNSWRTLPDPKIMQQVRASPSVLLHAAEQSRSSRFFTFFAAARVPAAERFCSVGPSQRRLFSDCHVDLTFAHTLDCDASSLNQASVSTQSLVSAPRSASLSRPLVIYCNIFLQVRAEAVAAGQVVHDL